MTSAVQTARTLQAAEITLTTTTLGALGADDFARWRDLEKRAIAAYPQISADYLEPAQRLRPGAAGLRLLIASRSDRWLLLLPFAVGTATDGATVAAITTDDETMDHESAKLYPLMDAVDGARALGVALSKLAALRLPRVARIVLVDDVDDVRDALVASVGNRRTRYVDGAHVVRPIARGGGERRALPAHGDAFAPQYTDPETSTSTRKKLGRVARRLAEQTGELSVVARRGDPAVIDDYLRLQTAGWKGDPSKGGEGYEATGRTPWFRAFLSTYLERDEVLAFDYRGGGRTLYTAIFLRQGDTIHGLQDAYDEEYAHYGVGTLGRRAVLNVIRNLDVGLIDPNMSWYNFEAARVYPERLGQCEYVLAGPGLRARAVVIGIRSARAVRSVKERLTRGRGGADKSAPTRAGDDE